MPASSIAKVGGNKPHHLWLKKGGYKSRSIHPTLASYKISGKINGVSERKVGSRVAHQIYCVSWNFGFSEIKGQSN